MFADPQSTLYTVLAIAIALLTVFLCVTLLYLILILRDTSKVLEKVRDTAERINNFIVKPVALASHIVDRIQPIVEKVLEQRDRVVKRAKKR